NRGDEGMLHAAIAAAAAGLEGSASSGEVRRKGDATHIKLVGGVYCNASGDVVPRTAQIARIRDRTIGQGPDFSHESVGTATTTTLYRGLEREVSGLGLPYGVNATRGIQSYPKPDLVIGPTQITEIVDRISSRVESGDKSILLATIACVSSVS